MLGDHCVKVKNEWRYASTLRLVYIAFIAQRLRYSGVRVQREDEEAAQFVFINISIHDDFGLTLTNVSLVTAFESLVCACSAPIMVWTLTQETNIMVTPHVWMRD